MKSGSETAFCAFGASADTFTAIDAPFLEYFRFSVFDANGFGRTKLNAGRAADA